MLNARLDVVIDTDIFAAGSRCQVDELEGVH